jgi:hypothetical protein
MNIVKIGAIAALTTFSGIASAALVDLVNWTQQGGGTHWAVAADRNSVFQRDNGDAAVFFSGTKDQGKALSGKIKVETLEDDDFIGFVLGYKSGDFVNGNEQEFILIDWKQANQEGPGNSCISKVGLAFSRVTAPLGPNTWCHNSGVTELARGINLGNTGWADNTEYQFDLIFTETNIQVKVNGVIELNIDGKFADGSFGFYNHSQESVRYSSLVEDAIAPPGNTVPEPETLALSLAALGLMGFTRREKRFV